MKSGQTYVNSMIDLAAKRLRERGNPISQNLIDIAKRLCIVEHVDHDRYRNDNRIALFEEIYTLYALNELETYRYAPIYEPIWQTCAELEMPINHHSANAGPQLRAVPGDRVDVLRRGRVLLASGDVDADLRRRVRPVPEPEAHPHRGRRRVGSRAC